MPCGVKLRSASPTADFVVTGSATAIPFMLIAAALLWLDPCYSELRADILKIVHSIVSVRLVCKGAVQSFAQVDETVG